MTIPRQLGPDSGPRTALPDYSRSSATVERMVSDLRRGTRGKVRRGATRVLLPAAGTRDTVIRAVIAALLLGGAFLSTVVILLLVLGLEDGRSPGLGLLLVLLSLAGLGVLLALLGLRFALVALATARSRVELSEHGLRVVGALRSRDVAWRDVQAIESRVVHPVHWLTAALRLRDGSRVVMPAFDRHIWTWPQPSGQDIRALRLELRAQEKAARRAF